MHKKGQAALEFLTTYSWAFLIILVMVGGFTYFGVFDISTTETCVSSVEFTCQTSTLTTEYQAIKLRNNLPEEIIIHNATLTKNGEILTTCLFNKYVPTETNFEIYCPASITENKKENFNIEFTYYSVSGNSAYSKTNTINLKGKINSVQEISQASTATHPSFYKLLGYWTFDEESGNILYDFSTIQNHGTIYSGSSRINQCIRGNCLSFNGLSAKVTIPDHPIYSFNNNDFSISVWAMKYTSNGSYTRFPVSKWNTGSSPGTNEWALGMNTPGASGQKPSFSIESGTTAYSISHSQDAPNNEWMHLVGVREQQVIKLYVNGELVNSTNIGNITLNDVPQRNITLGMLRETEYFLNGKIDELRIYNKSLTSEEVKILYITRQ